MPLKDFFKDVTHSINERVRNPYWFSFLFIFIYINWESLLVLINIGDFKDIADKKTAILPLEWSILKPLLLAFVGVIIFYVIQYIGLSISIFFQDRLKPNLVNLISSKRVATAEKVEGLISLNSQLQKDKSQILEDLGKQREEVDVIKEDHGKEIEEFEKGAKKQSDDIKKLKTTTSSQINELENRIVQLSAEVKSHRETKERLGKEAIKLEREKAKLNEALNKMKLDSKKTVSKSKDDSTLPYWYDSFEKEIRKSFITSVMAIGGNRDVSEMAAILVMDFFSDGEDNVILAMHHFLQRDNSREVFSQALEGVPISLDQGFIDDLFKVVSGIVEKYLSGHLATKE